MATTPLIERSENFAAIAAALAKAQSEFLPVEKNCTAKISSKRTGQTFTYDYADRAAIRDATIPALTKYGLALFHAIATEPPDNDGEPREGEQRGLTRISVQTELVHESGEWFRTPLLEIDVDAGEIKEVGIVATYFSRYQTEKLLGIAAEEGDAEGERKENFRAAPPAAGAGNFRCANGHRHTTAQGAKECKDATPAGGVEPGNDAAPMTGGSEEPAQPDHATIVRKAIATKDWQTALTTLTALPPGKLKEDLKTEYQAARHGPNGARS